MRDFKELMEKSAAEKKKLTTLFGSQRQFAVLSHDQKVEYMKELIFLQSLEDPKLAKKDYEKRYNEIKQDEKLHAQLVSFAKNKELGTDCLAEIEKKKRIPMPGDDDFTLKTFKEQAYRNGWDKTKDKKLLNTMFAVYQSAEKLMENALFDDNQMSGVHDILKDIMTIGGNIENKRKYILEKAENEVSKTEAMSDLFADDLSELQLEAAGTAKRKMTVKPEQPEILTAEQAEQRRMQAEKAAERVRHEKKQDELFHVFNNQEKYKKLTGQEREKLMADYMTEFIMSDSNFRPGTEKRLHKNISSLKKQFHEIAYGIASGKQAMALIQNNYAFTEIAAGCLKGHPGNAGHSLEDAKRYDDLIRDESRKVSASQIKGNVALEERQAERRAEAERVRNFEKRQEGLPSTEEDRLKFKSITTGLKSNAWYMSRHKDSQEIENLRIAVKNVSFSIHERGMGSTAPDADTRAMLLEAYKASVAYQEKLRREANASHSNKNWKPKSGVGKERYLSAQQIEEYARKYIADDIEAYELEQREKDLSERFGKIGDKKGTDTIPMNSVIAKSIAEAQKDLDKPEVKNAQNARDISGALAHILAARMVGEIYTPHLDKKGQLPEHGRYSSEAYERDVKAVTLRLEQRSDFQKMLETINQPADALSMAGSINGRVLALRFGSIYKSVPKESFKLTEPAEKPVTVNKDLKKTTPVKKNN